MSDERKQVIARVLEKLDRWPQTTRRFTRGHMGMPSLYSATPLLITSPSSRIKRLLIIDNNHGGRIMLICRVGLLLGIVRKFLEGNHTPRNSEVARNVCLPPQLSHLIHSMCIN